MNNEHAVKLGNIIGYSGQSRVNAQGFSGGIWLYWKPEIVSVSTVTEHQQYITIEIARTGEVPWFFSAVYASPDPTNRKELWSELENFAKSNNRPWLLAGDFNETRYLSERHGEDANMARRCENFNNWIDNCDLIELAFSGASHTWARGNLAETRQSARLDRALCNANWSTIHADALVKHLPAFQSDHCPLLISPNGFAPLSTINRPFRFQACWMKHENFKDFVEESWPVDGIFQQKLSTLARKLKDWNTQIFGNIFRKKKELMARIGGCQRELSLRRIPYLIKLEAKLRRELDEVMEQEELLWYQKSRLEFIRDGDRNTSYFHTEPVEDRLPWDLFQAFNNKDWEWLTRPYTIAEIESLIKALEGKGLPEGLNDTHLVLIPKVTNPETISQFRPIGLCNVSYKIISKILANRVKKVLPHLISETQSGFVPGRQITDNIVVFQEAIHSMRKKTGRIGFMAIKIDLEKVYDRLRWSFIRDTLQDMQFSILLVDVIMECVTSTRLQVLWNGEATEQFTPTRGVRQGDPLSSYLFIMCLKKLQQAIDVEVCNKNWRPITLGRNGPSITNLFFADDMVIFAETTEEQALVICHVIDNFCAVSGEKVSASKSRVFFSKNTDEATRQVVG
ncbi:uncharacterized protein LOC141631726 [Silene latifolia]|uniref:uncharacterized protein LOC141631726 n=1 Tax=Silene latifolia TaxID=37657 RepID=UPI003D778554